MKTCTGCSAKNKHETRKVVNRLKRIVRKLFCFVLVVVFCFSGISALAVDGDADVPADVIDAIEHVIESIAFEKEYYGFAGVDLTKIMVGSQIPAYEAVEGELVPISDISYYPIFDDTGHVVSMAAIKYYDGQALAFLGSELVPVIDEYAGSEDIALIYDQFGVYCWDTNSIELIALNNIESGVEYRTELQDITPSEFLAVSVEPVVAVSEMNISTSSIMPFGYDDEAAYISAPVKRQPDDSAWCWAACMACIVQIETGDFYNCVTMGRRYTSDYNYRATISTVNNWLNNDFGLDYSIERDGSYLTSILNTLAHGHAVFGGFTGMTGHASIIRGIDFGSKTFSVMDPQDAVTDYLTGQIVNSYGNYGTMTYVQFVTSETLILGEYLYVNA